MRVKYGDLYEWKVDTPIVIDVDDEVLIALNETLKEAAKFAVNNEDFGTALSCLKSIESVRLAMEEYKNWKSKTQEEKEDA